MKKIISTIIGIFLLGIFINHSIALSVNFNGNTVDVGGIDLFISSGNIKSGDSIELAQVRSILNNQNIDLVSKYTNASQYWNWIPTNELGTYAMHFITTEPDYFMIKTGNTSLPDNHFLFQNIDNVNWAVINLSTFGISDPYNIGKLSHIGEFKDTHPVNEPATLLLLGSGLIALRFVRSRFPK